MNLKEMRNPRTLTPSPHGHSSTHHINLPILHHSTTGTNVNPVILEPLLRLLLLLGWHSASTHTTSHVPTSDSSKRMLPNKLPTSSLLYRPRLLLLLLLLHHHLNPHVLWELHHLIVLLRQLGICGSVCHARRTLSWLPLRNRLHSTWLLLWGRPISLCLRLSEV